MLCSLLWYVDNMIWIRDGWTAGKRIRLCLGGWRLHRTETSYLGDRYWLLPLGPSGVHDEKFIGKQYRVSQNKVTITKKSTPKKSAVGPNFLSKKRPKNNLPTTDDWACAPWLQHHSVSNFFGSPCIYEHWPENSIINDIFYNQNDYLHPDLHNTKNDILLSQKKRLSTLQP